jgi:NAD(P)-dependent dehydrogenase (short-subunit alcohol dehydrogenase family)
MGQLDGQVALVTGASRGIGQAIALALADEGASLHLVADGTAEELAQTAATCRARAAGVVATHAVVDLSQPEVPAATIEGALRLHGRIDVLVNNAGIRIRKPFGEFSADDFDRVMAVNVRAPMLAAQAAAAHMRTRGSGRIINIASQLGSVTDVNASLYGLSKAALLYLTRAMAVELVGAGILVNAVSPGTTATEFILTTFSDERLASRLQHIPAGRLAQPDEIAQAVRFLAATASAFLVGHNLVIDGGETAR